MDMRTSFRFQVTIPVIILFSEANSDTVPRLDTGKFHVQVVRSLYPIFLN